MKNLVNYSSSSESENEDESNLIVEKKIKLDLPMLLDSKAETNSQVENQLENPENHQMRIRSIPHVSGHWASHIKIDCDFNESIIDQLRQIISTYDEIHLIESPHLSLSKTFILKHHWIDNFVTTLKSKFKDSKQDEVFLQFNKSQVLFLSNEEKTRHFACLPVEEYAYSILKSILDKVDSCLEEFNLPTYYKDPKLHISILWKLNEFTEDEKVYIENQLNKINENLEFNATQINFKTGNKFFNINL